MIIVISAVIFLGVACGVGYFYSDHIQQTINSNQSQTLTPWRAEVSQKESKSKQVAFDFVTEMIEQYPNDEYLHCERARVATSIYEFTEALISLKECWSNVKEETKNTIGKVI